MQAVIRVIVRDRFVTAYSVKWLIASDVATRPITQSKPLEIVANRRAMIALIVIQSWVGSNEHRRISYTVYNTAGIDHPEGLCCAQLVASARSSPSTDLNGSITTIQRAALEETQMKQNSARNPGAELHSRRKDSEPSQKSLALFPRGAACAALFALIAIPNPTPAQTGGSGTVSPAYLAGLHWRNIGPFRSGNVYAVTGIPSDPTTYYIGTPEAGIWKTSDAGTEWKPVFDDMHVASIGAIAASPSNPGIVYAGTGDPSGWSFSQGNGVYKTTDAGATWRNIGLDGTRYINAIIVDPHNPDIVLVGAAGAAQAGSGPNEDRGVYRSTDGGATWKKVLYIDQYTGVEDMTVDVSDPSVIYAAFARAAFGASRAELAKLAPLATGIYKSTDEGLTWNPVSGHGLPAHTRSYEIAVASGTNGQRIYAEAQGSGRDAGGVYRSDDGGESWSLGTKEIGSAGGRIYADPRNPDVLYLMGTSMYRSTDGAHTFTAFKGAPGGDDDRDLWINPSDSRRMLMGADQGPTITVDDGATWTPWYNLPNGQFYNVVTDFDFPYHVCGSQQDSGTACVASRSDYGRIRENDWYAVGGFESGAIVPDTLHPRWIYTQGWYHVLRRYDRVTGQVAVLYTPTPEDHFGGLPPMGFSPQNPHLLYMAAQYLMASTDSGRDWHHASPDLTAIQRTERTDTASAAVRFRRYSPSIQSMSLSTRAAGEIWAGTSNGLVQMTRDAGQHWSNVTPAALPQRALVDAIDASHTTPGVAYISVRAAGDWHPYIYRTTDFGKSWTKIVAGLPDDAPVRVVREDPVAPNLLYAGTVTGAWVSFDRGDHWQSLELNLPNTVVSDITVHGNDLAISTYGRALWIMDDVTPLRKATEAVAAGGTYLYQPELTYRVRWDNDQDTPRPPEVPAGENAPEGAIIYYYLNTAASGPVTLSIRDAQGNLVRKYTEAAPPEAVLPNVPTYWFPKPAGLPASAGMHRVVWDLRYEDPMTLPYGYYGNILTYTEYTLTWHAVKGHTPSVQPPGPIAIPGTYTVDLTVNGHTYSRQFTVKNDPRVSIPQAYLATQLQSELEMTRGMATSYTSFYQIDRMRKRLASDASSSASASSLDKQLATIADSSFGVVNRDLARHLEDADFGDLLPTRSDLAAIASSCKQLDSAVAALRNVERTSIPKLNAELTAAHVAPLEPEPVPPNAGCGNAATLARAVNPRR